MELSLYKKGTLALMALFLSSHVNKLDKKGRISVPSSFRAELDQELFQGVVLFKSNVHKCLEGFTWSYMNEISARLDNFNLFSSEQDDLATSIFGSAVKLSVDGNGRIVLPSDLIEFAGLNEKATFVGMGTKFQIWETNELKSRQQKARQSVQDNALTIPKVLGGSNG